jgi:aarF domain-containing kinase
MYVLALSRSDAGGLMIGLQVRVFLVTARYCALAAWQDDRQRVYGEIRRRGYFTAGLLWDWVSCWW